MRKLLLVMCVLNLVSVSAFAIENRKTVAFAEDGKIQCEHIAKYMQENKSQLKTGAAGQRAVEVK